MLYLFLLASLTGLSSALVCTPQLCNMMGPPKPLNCTGSVIKNGGFCGCSDACAKVEGETCQAVHVFGMMPVGTCDDGLQCVQNKDEHFRLGVGLCQATKQVSERFLDDSTQTICQTIRAQRMISFVIWDGMWTPNCDKKGLFLPEQCDNQHKCFCVDAHFGHLLTERMLGHVDCSSINTDVTTTVKPNAVTKRTIGNTQTICQTIRAQRMISFVIWDGMWTPNCDEKGLFLPEQCDNQHKCFCVDAHDGHLLTERMLGHVDCSTIATTDTSNSNSPVSSALVERRSTNKCRQLKAKAMTSLVVYEGMWVPQCDMHGMFMKEQCDFNHKCFCVDVHDGHLLTERMLGHPDCSSIANTVTPVLV